MRLFYKRNEGKAYEGFTLLESIVSLAVLVVVCLSFNWLFRIEQKLTLDQGLPTSINWHLFLIQLNNNSKEWEFVKLERKRLYFLDANEPIKNNYIIIEQYKDQLKKQKAIGGYEPLLLAVAVADFTVTPDGLKLAVRMKDGSSYEAIFSEWVPQGEKD